MVVWVFASLWGEFVVLRGGLVGSEDCRDLVHQALESLFDGSEKE